MSAKTITNLPILESAHNIRAPRVKSTISTDGEEIIIVIMNKKRELFKIASALTPDLNIISILNTIESMARDHRIKRIQWPKRDILFVLEDIQNFKDIYLQQNRHLRIILTDPIKYVKDAAKREKIVKDAHIDSISKEHFSRRKTTARLQSQYYWKRITREAAHFVKSCDQCREKRLEAEKQAHTDHAK